MALPVEFDSSSYCIKPFSNRDLADRYISIGDELLVVGYPLGIFDSKHNTPIIRSASMASVYPLHFMGKNHFLIDSRLHEGTSGSPVLLKPNALTRTAEGKYCIDGGEVGDIEEDTDRRNLIGIHSGDYSPDNIPTNLNEVWFAELIPDIINNAKSIVELDRP